MLYKKYKPESFSDFIGNEKLITFFKFLQERNKLKNIILCGPCGCGKTSLINVFLEKYQDYKIYRLIPENLNNLEKLKNIVRIYGKKIFFIDDCIDFSLDFQKSLNILYDNSKNSIFIINTMAVDIILPSILSKFFILNFENIDNQVLYEYFNNIVYEEKIDIPDEKLKEIIKYSNEDFRSIFNSLENFEIDDKLIIDILFYNKPLKEMIKGFKEVYNQGYTANNILLKIKSLIKEKNKNKEINLETYNQIIKELSIIEIRINDGCNSFIQLIQIINIIYRNIYP